MDQVDSRSRAAAEERAAVREEPSALPASSRLLARRMTSEMELLISGALIFSLLQLPERLMGVALLSFRRLSDQLGFVPFFAAYLGTLVVFLLTAAFGIHFLVRSFWVALRGLNNVFPGGIDWDRVDSGPMTKQALRAVLPAPVQLEERADRVASTIFSVLFYMLLSMVSVFAVGGVCWVVGWVLVQLTGLQVSVMTVFYATMAVMLAPLFAVSLIDGYYKRKRPDVDASSRVFRFGSRVVRVYQRVLGGRLYAPIALVFSTRFSTVRTSMAFAGAIFTLIAVFVVSLMVASGRIGFDSYHYLPDTAAAGELKAASYQDRRPADDPPTLRPTLQSAVITGPYLELFVPYDVDEDSERLQRACPDLEPARREGLHRVSRRPPDDREVRRRLDCLSRIYRVEIDGEPVDFEPVLARDETTGLRGVAAFLPARGLGSGRHVLTVGRDVPPAEDEEERDEDDAPRVVEIPFWR